MGERVWALVTRTAVCFSPFVSDVSRMKYETEIAEKIRVLSATIRPRAYRKEKGHFT